MFYSLNFLKSANKVGAEKTLKILFLKEIKKMTYFDLTRVGKMLYNIMFDTKS